MKLGAVDRELGALTLHEQRCSAKKGQAGHSECGLHSANTSVGQCCAARSLGLRSLVGNWRNSRLLHRTNYWSLLHRGSWLSWS